MRTRQASLRSAMLTEAFEVTTIGPAHAPTTPAAPTSAPASGTRRLGSGTPDEWLCAKMMAVALSAGLPSYFIHGPCPAVLGMAAVPSTVDIDMPA